ncbi:hypothetical protein LDENG_00180410 [Lucifuga dentata]|nr:hypothetical protein LDENG_00180410 [Lucifuga dentata]
MRVTTTKLLICVFFLSRLEDRVLCQRGYCTEDRCYAVFQESADFLDAQKKCKDHGGHLMTLQSLQAQEMVMDLLSGYTGRYWIGLQMPSSRCPDLTSQLLGYRWTAGDAATNFHNWGTADTNCSSKCVSVFTERNSTWWQESCHDKLTGFVCQHGFDEPCKRLEVCGAAQVTYTMRMGFQEDNLASFPLGTIALKKNAGLEHPLSKYICFGGWLKAPWNCEVKNGGCQHSCVPHGQKPLCACPAGQTLHANNITCVGDPCADCAHQCHREGGAYVCRCNKGYRLAQDKKGCVDVNECEEDTCRENEECVNTEGGFTCVCREGFIEEDGECVNIEICDKCEHMDCRKFNGVYECVCRAGFRVSDKDPTKCEIHCTERDCLANCIPNPDPKPQDSHQCYCPVGYIQDIRNNTPICTDIDECDNERVCDHHCVNSYGSYKCLCDEGFDLIKGHTCVSTEEEEDGSGSTTPYPTSVTAHAQPVAVPSYVKMGSVLGIGVFMMLCAVLLYFLVRNMLKRCGRFHLSSLKEDMDSFYLQQVTTEKYKRFSF